ncbi:oxidoreductase [Chitinophaga polysaccharea]|uniref:putative oxidoreductase C-terminal domain-containing protein n=1 Tax=Chitinophaga polysaccharea TaxID=1293035 RepID=UPI0014553B79|nr:putative oxidoreductase C-terminal domain-containing protein [Chitinophaga polysaccharea]NLR57385.1 oxidoreductase [Chitinophaga polysaccharea]
MKQSIIFIGIAVLSLLSCTHQQKKQMPMQLIALDPGHFHASMVQQQMYPGVDSIIRVFAPEGPGVQQYLQQVAAYNRPDSPAVHWTTQVHTGADYLEKMLLCPRGNIVVLAGNNRLKPLYIRRAVHAGMHVFADKPMAIDAAGFDSLRAAFTEAAANHLQLMDVMTERYDIHNVLQRALSQLPALFGTLEKGSAGEPAVIKKSVHHFKKTVAGKTLVRPSWYMDVKQQGEGITDVTTHLVDLVQWTCFAEKVLDYQKDIQVISATTWPTVMTLQQYSDVTGERQFTPALQESVGKDSLLNVYANGAFDYTICGVHARIAVQWDYEAPAGTGDTHYSQIRGSKASLVIRQDKEQNYKPVLYIVPVSTDTAYTQQMKAAFQRVERQYPGIALKSAGEAWEVVIPQQYATQHESLFAQVMQQFLQYIRSGHMPAWEVPGMLAKYYTTTQALAIAKRIK